MRRYNDMTNVKLSPPWEIYRKKIEALFDGDPDVICVWDAERCEEKLLVTGQDKAEALSALLPAEKDFGGVTMLITVVPDNGEKDMGTLFRQAFNGNPLFNEAVRVGLMGGELTFVEFKPEVVQFYGDNMQDLRGNITTLPETVAREIFADREGVFFCTAAKQD